MKEKGGGNEGWGKRRKEEGGKGEEQDDLFFLGFLELSDRQDYNPYEFCFSFKDYGGNPVNVSVQQDTQEFLNMIFEKLENSLKRTPFRNILDGYKNKQKSL